MQWLAKPSAATVAALLLVASGPAFASGAPEGETTRFCASVVAHRPADDVAYKPGLDAEGRAVTPADVSEEGRLDLGERFSIDIFARLSSVIPIPAGSALEKIQSSEVAIGEVTVEKGTVFFDGKPLSSAEQNAVAAACRRLQERHEGE